MQHTESTRYGQSIHNHPYNSQHRLTKMELPDPISKMETWAARVMCGCGLYPQLLQFNLIYRDLIPLSIPTGYGQHMHTIPYTYLTHEINKLKSEDRSPQLGWHDARVWVMATLSYCCNNTSISCTATLFHHLYLGYGQPTPQMPCEITKLKSEDRSLQLGWQDGVRMIQWCECPFYTTVVTKL